jgi:ABC-type lipopolysaccharide export system ATPase subunit
MVGLHVDSVNKSYRGKIVLSDIYLSLKPGEIVGMLGRNGSGKSTLMKIIFGSVIAENRFIKIDSDRVSKPFENFNKIRYLPQDSYLPKDVSIEKIIRLFGDNLDAEKLRSDPFVSEFLQKTSRQLSGGEKRIIEILLIVYSNSRYILLDEPFNGVAPKNIEDIKAKIKVQSPTKGIILTDHDYRNIIDISDRMILLFDGGTKEVKSLEELKYWGYVPEIN